MKQIKGWQCSDGRCFFNQKDAETHERMIKVEGWLIEDPSFFHGGLAGVDCAKELIDFLQRNEKSILELMNWRPERPCEFQHLIGGGYLCKTCDKTFDDITPRCLKDR